MSLLPDKFVQECGEYFGYPQCCIDDFKARLTALTISPEQEAVHFSVGFIPCQKHALQILAGEITQASLITNRQCDLPFPIGRKEDKHMESIINYHNNVQAAPFTKKEHIESTP